MDHHGVERAILAFTCVNALVAMGFASQYPARVASLALAQVASVDQMQAFTRRIDFSIFGVPVLRTPIVGQAFMIAARTAIAHRWFRAALPRAFDTDRVWTDTRKVLDAGGVFCLASLMQGLSSIRPEDVKTDVAASVAWGMVDRTHRPTDKASIRAHLPRATIDMMAECGHCPDIEAPEAYSRRLLALCQH
jgi:pimeloyl-ACP methyl ester carboxylesterase